MPDPRSTSWLRYPVPRPAASLRLVCLPHAGGGAAVFRDWAEELPPDIEVVAVRLPGRESRMHEPALADWTTLVGALREEIERSVEPPFALLGHSLGAMLAHEIELSWRPSLPPPEHLVLAGCSAPGTAAVEPAVAEAQPDALIGELRRRGALPDHVVRNPALLTALLPMIRADHGLAESWPHRSARADPTYSTVDITVLSGDRDTIAPPDAGRRWARFAGGRFAHHMVPGDHFFMHRNRSAALPLVARALTGRELASA